jgi:hypothetical protein
VAMFSWASLARKKAGGRSCIGTSLSAAALLSSKEYCIVRNMRLKLPPPHDPSTLALRGTPHFVF